MTSARGMWRASALAVVVSGLLWSACGGGSSAPAGSSSGTTAAPATPPAAAAPAAPEPKTVADIFPEGAGKARDADQAVGAAGDVTKPEQHGVAELREGEREHREGHAGRARADPGDRHRDQDRDGDRQQDPDVTRGCVRHAEVRVLRLPQDAPRSIKTD